jgi:hypothetical protein
MFAIVGLFIIATFAVGAISILVPLRRLGITTRLRGLAVAFVSVLAFILFGAFISATRSPEEKARLEAKQTERTQEQQKTKPAEVPQPSQPTQADSAARLTAVPLVHACDQQLADMVADKARDWTKHSAPEYRSS